MPTERHRRPTKTARRTAYHEAGHAVAACVQHRAQRLRLVTIEPDPQQKTLGLTQCWSTPAFWRRLEAGGEWDNRDQLRLEQEIIMLLAGGIADRRVGRRAAGLQRDYALAADYALAVSGSPRIANAFLEWLRLTTENLVALWWPAIEAVAAELLARRTLSGPRVQALVLEAGCASPPVMDSGPR